MGWVAAQPSRLTWDEWRNRSQRGGSIALPVTAVADDLPSARDMPELRIVELEQICGQLTVENAGLRTALAHWQRQPVAAGA
jgi:hypothetical protein